MANTDDKPALKITLEDLAKVTVRQEPLRTRAATAAPGTAKQYGNIATPDPHTAIPDEGKSKFYMQGWFYLGIAGLLGALIGWAIGEPFFRSVEQHTSGNPFLTLLVIPLVVTFMCLGFSIAESIVERSLRKAWQHGALSLPLGLVFSVFFMLAGGLVFEVGKQISVALGVLTYKNPAFWVARSLAWMVFASAAGVVYGFVDRSARKGRYGVLGAVIGGGIGGILFDPISMLSGTGGPSRAVGFALIGLATGLAIGIVESALKDRWLYVAAGPLAGKQFILYKPVTMIGCTQQSDIYLFKDPSVEAQHASVELRGAQTFLHALGPVSISGQPARNRALESGDLIQIGRYAFHFRERQRNR